MVKIEKIKKILSAVFLGAAAIALIVTWCLCGYQMAILVAALLAAAGMLVVGVYGVIAKHIINKKSNKGVNG